VGLDPLLPEDATATTGELAYLRCYHRAPIQLSMPRKPVTTNYGCRTSLNPSRTSPANSWPPIIDKTNRSTAELPNTSQPPSSGSTNPMSVSG
jgi:hypothetical protein